MERLLRIQELTTELGMNLAGVEKVFELETELARMRGACATWSTRPSGWRPSCARRSSACAGPMKAELVPYEAPGQALQPGAGGARSGSGSTAPEEVAEPPHAANLAYRSQ